MCSNGISIHCDHISFLLWNESIHFNRIQASGIFFWFFFLLLSIVCWFHFVVTILLVSFFFFLLYLLRLNKTILHSLMVKCTVYNIYYPFLRFFFLFFYGLHLLWENRFFQMAINSKNNTQKTKKQNKK